MVCFRGIGNEENYRDSLANAAKRCKRESETTCSAARTTRVRFKRSGDIPLCQQRPGSVGVSSEEIRPEAVHERVCVPAKLVP
jgi:hypothetical protein